MKKIALSLLALIMILSLTACFGSKPVGEWGTVSYSEDTTLGKGAKTATIEIVTEEKTVTITLKTDEEILGTALIAEKLIGGEEGAYGLYVKEVNGVVADYDVDQTYWAFWRAFLLYQIISQWLGRRAHRWRMHGKGNG